MQLLTRALEPLGIVLLTRERIQETLEDAARRGRVTRSDANDLALELVRRGRHGSEDLLAQVLGAIEAGVSGAGRIAGRTRRQPDDE